MPTLNLRLLGPLLLTLDDSPIGAFESDKVRALLIYLAVEADRPHRRGALAELLWPDRPERQALLNLNQALSNLRRAIGDRAATVPPLLITREALQFNASADHTLDLAEFNSLLDASERHEHRSPSTCAPCAERLERAVALYRGPFLAQFLPRDSYEFQDWSLVVRERLHRRMLGALEQLLAFYERRGDTASALRIGYRLVDLDPWREDAHRALMRLLWRDGQRGAALTQFERCRDLLDTELGVEPDDETTALYELILAGDDGGAAAPAPHRPAAPPSHATPPELALPASATPFVGREAELAALADRLSTPSCRLASIVGLGGAGKTRLALRAAQANGPAFADGSRFVALAPIQSDELIVPTIAGALGLALGGADPLDELLAHLRERELLLVMDNLEHLPGAAATIGALLARAPKLTILATSRERLRLRDEWVLDLAGLSLPVSADDLERSGAAALFLQAARRAQADFAVSSQDRQAIARICRMLGGHPLGIELAAAWAHTLSAAEIADELAQGLDLLASDARDMPERHRTIRAVFEASWRQLSGPERAAVERLSVFRGGCDREAAAQVAGAGTPMLAALIGRALVRRGEDGRYHMHELVRQYAAEQLRGEAETDAWRRHLAFYTALIEATEPHLKGAEEHIWLDRITVEHDNIRAALGRALELGDLLSAAKMGGVLRWFWYVRGHIGEGREWLGRILAAIDAGDTLVDPKLRARMLQGLGILADEQTDYRAATTHLEAAMALYRSIGDDVGEQATVHSLGMLAWVRGQYERARELFEHSLALSRTLNNTWGVANRLNSLGYLVFEQGETAQAIVYLEEALALARGLGHEQLLAMVLGNVGEATLAQGDTERSRAVFEEALARQRQLRDMRTASTSLQGLGMVALALGQPGRAAERMYEGLDLLVQHGTQRDLAGYAEGLAALLLAQGRPADAVQQCAAADAFRARTGTPLSPLSRGRYEHTLAQARAALDDDAYHSAWAAGRVAPLEGLARALLQ